jgi:UDP-glucuronate decarboxylase
LVDGLLAFMRKPGVVGPLNLGNPCEFTVLELARRVLELTGSKSRIVHAPLPEDDPKVRRPDISKARALLGFEPRVPLADGLEKTIEFFGHALGRAESSGLRSIESHVQRIKQSVPAVAPLRAAKGAGRRLS